MDACDGTGTPAPLQIRRSARVSSLSVDERGRPGSGRSKATSCIDLGRRYDPEGVFSSVVGTIGEPTRRSERDGEAPMA